MEIAKCKECGCRIEYTAIFPEGKLELHTAYENRWSGILRDDDNGETPPPILCEQIKFSNPILLN